MRIERRLCGATILLLLACCGPKSFEHDRAFFRAHRPELEALAQDLLRCEIGTFVLPGNVAEGACLGVSLDDIDRRARALGLENVHVRGPSDGSQGYLEVHLVTGSSGFLVTESESVIVRLSKPVRYTDGAPNRPLTGPPTYWWWYRW